MTRAGRWPAPFVVITGGKGGVGKTVVTANLGVHLARQGGRVLLVDLDLGLANLDVVLGVTPERTVEDALAGRAELEDCVAEGPDGVHLLAAGSGTVAMGRDDEARHRRLLAGVARLAPRYDLVLADSPSGIGPDVLSTACAADLVVLVTTPEPAALTDAYGLMRALDTHAGAARIEVPTPELCVNLAADLGEAEASAVRLRGLCERFLARSPRLAGWLPRQAALHRACRERRPYPVSGRNPLLDHCLRRLAARLERHFEAPVQLPLAALKGT